MSESTKMILIALGAVLLVVAVLPVLFMAGMMGSMGMMMGGSGAWLTAGLMLLIFVAALVLLAVALSGKSR